jgi:hypothetical protein
MDVEDGAAASAACRIADNIGKASSSSGSKKSDKDLLLADMKALQSSLSINDVCLEILRDRSIKLLSKMSPRCKHIARCFCSQCINEQVFELRGEGVVFKGQLCCSST